MTKLQILVGLSLVLLAAAQDSNAIPSEIELPTRYEWLNIDMLPMLTEEQWLELQTLMQEEHFEILTGLLGGVYPTAIPSDLETTLGFGETPAIDIIDEEDISTEEEVEEFLEEIEEQNEDGSDYEESVSEEILEEENENEILEEEYEDEILEQEYEDDEQVYENDEEDYEEDYEDDYSNAEHEPDSSEEMATEASLLDMLLEAEIDEEMETTAYPADIWETDYEETTMADIYYPSNFGKSKYAGRSLVPKHNSLLPEEKDGYSFAALWIALPIVGLLLTILLITGIVCACRRKSAQHNYRKFENAGQLIDEKKQPV